MQKERYYTSETIQKNSRKFLSLVEPLRRRHADIPFRPRKAALLVLDLQEYFLQERSHAFIPSALATLPGINKLIAAFTGADRPLVFTRHINTPKDAGMMSKWWRDLINPQTAYSHNITTTDTPNSIHLNKAQYDAFHQTSLENTLHSLKVEQVVICGVVTHLCCETTARSAFMRGFEVFFTVDGTATYNEELHRASLLTLSHGFAVPMLIQELLAAMESDET
jgi:bifunctional isochorismate lyase/aryl carrier protein